MPLDLVPPSSPHGNLSLTTKHCCSLNVPCDINLSKVGKHFHSFPKGTFCLHYTPPFIPHSILWHFRPHPFTWLWTVKNGPNSGRSISVSIIPIAYPKGSAKVIHWMVSLFHSFKVHLNSITMRKDSWTVHLQIVHLYQNNMLLHFHVQLKSLTTHHTTLNSQTQAILSSSQP